MGDPEFWMSFKNTLIYGLVQVPITVILSTIAAVLVNQKIKGIQIYRTIFFLPMIAAPAAVAMVWRWMYNSDYGLINNALTVYDICEIYRTSDKTEETINAERTLEGCLTNMKSYIFKYNALCSQIEQHLQIAKDRITTQNI